MSTRIESSSARSHPRVVVHARCNLHTRWRVDITSEQGVDVVLRLRIAHISGVSCSRAGGHLRHHRGGP